MNYFELFNIPVSVTVDKTSLAKKYFVNRIEQEKSLESYYNKVKAATNAVVAFEFYQAEVYLLTQIRASIMQQIPTYGELERAKRK